MTSIAAPTDIEWPTMRNATASTEPDGEFDRRSVSQTMGNTSQVDLLSDAASIAVTPDSNDQTTKTPSSLPTEIQDIEDGAANTTGTAVEEGTKPKRPMLATAGTVAAVSTVGALLVAVPTGAGLYLGGVFSPH